MIREGTLESLWTYLACTMNTIQYGVDPSEDWRGVRLKGAGQELAKGWRGSCVQILGDWELFAQCLGVAR